MSALPLGRPQPVHEVNGRRPFAGCGEAGAGPGPMFAANYPSCEHQRGSRWRRLRPYRSDRVSLSVGSAVAARPPRAEPPATQRRHVLTEAAPVSARRRKSAVDVEFAQLLADRISLSIEQRHLLRRTRRAIAARDLAVRMVSHDLGNPLSTIEICSGALLDPEPPSSTDVRHMARIIQRSAAWMRLMLQDLLDRASLDAGRLTLDRQHTAVSKILRSAEALFRPVANERSLSLVVERTADVPLVDADPHRLLQVLSNLLGNAMHFTAAGGRVRLSARAEHDDRVVRIAVSDTGVGIPPEDLPHLFDWFWRSKRDGRGTGLGLGIAKALVEAHGGRLGVDSVAGHGSTFWFTVPAVSTA